MHTSPSALETALIVSAVALGLQAPAPEKLAEFEIIEFRLVTGTDSWFTTDGQSVAEGIGNGYTPCGTERRRLIARKRKVKAPKSNLITGHELELISKGTSLGLPAPSTNVLKQHEITALAVPTEIDCWLACDGVTVMAAGLPAGFRYAPRFILKPRGNAAQPNVVTGTGAGDAAQQEEYSPKPQSSGATSEGETMNKFIATIVARPVKKDGETIPARIVAELPAIVADSVERARTSFTATIARDEKLAHVLEQPEAFQIQLVHVPPTFNF